MGNQDVDRKMNEENIARWLLEKPSAEAIQTKLGVDESKAHRLAAFGAMASVRGMGGLSMLRRQVALEMSYEPVKRFVRNAGGMEQNMGKRMSTADWAHLHPGMGLTIVPSGRRHINWRTTDRWVSATLFQSDVEGSKIIGSRKIDGYSYKVYKTRRGEIVAQLPQYASNSRMKSLTYGIVPEYEEFHRHVTTWKNEDGEGIRASESPVLQMELNEREGTLAEEAAKDIPGAVIGEVERRAGTKHVRYMTGVQLEDVAALWAFINSLVHHADDADEEGDEKMADAYRDLASSLMYTLGYEWI